MSQTLHFDEIARLPMAGDNVAIATRPLDAGTHIEYDGQTFALNYGLLEGHRFAVKPIASGQDLLSWELPFGEAIADIQPGHYVCNEGILEALRLRNLSFELPAAPNFIDRIEPYQLDADTFTPGQQVEGSAAAPTFSGYGRGGDRGVGTRNYIVILGTTSRTASYARTLATRLNGEVADRDHIDGVVALAHTEGGGQTAPNNKELLLRTLSGFIIHPNVGAVLAVDYGSEVVTNEMLRDYITAHDYPLEHVEHHFLSLKGSFAQQLEEGESVVRAWFDAVGATPRQEHSVEHLKIALQCGGSDAFSGISGNPLAAWVGREIIRHGGSANLAETDELIGAEPYVLQNVRDLQTAQKFLATIERFKERVAAHGASAEGNPSGGNKFRGLYNIVLKSIGAARKRDPEVCLDYVIDYGQRMGVGGYYFMDSPGNDLESIAGQVASGANLIYFVTGNGSITNFPFAPTIKIVTTSARFELLQHDMDVNAGAYQDGTSMDDLGADLLKRTLDVASGSRSRGELAGHAQVSIWRNWQRQDAEGLDEILDRPEPLGEALAIQTDAPASDLRFEALKTASGHASDQIGLILPTSLCSGQIARMTAERLNAKGLGSDKGLSRIASLVHTEGCGVSLATAEHDYSRILVGYLTHPLVCTALLLEHGCEKAHNDFVRHEIEKLGVDPSQFGWASVQLDGGIDKVMDRVEQWYDERVASISEPEPEEVGLECLHVGLLNAGPVSDPLAAALAQLTRTVVGGGGTVVIPSWSTLLQAAAYLEPVLGDKEIEPNLPHAQRMETTGFYIMDMPSEHWVETLTSLGATGVEVLLAHVGEHPQQGHPFLPLLQVTCDSSVNDVYGEDLDLLLDGAEDRWSVEVLDLLLRTVGRQYAPKLAGQGNVDFQITRGLLGVST